MLHNADVTASSKHKSWEKPLSFLDRRAPYKRSERTGRCSQPSESRSGLSVEAGVRGGTHAASWETRPLRATYVSGKLLLPKLPSAVSSYAPPGAPRAHACPPG